MGQTPNYLLPYPEAPEPADVPTDMRELATATDSAIKTTTDALDSRLDVLEAQAAAGFAETGDLCVSMRTSKAGWILCDGRQYSTTTYAALYALLGTDRVPDFRGCTIVGFDANQIEFNAMGKGGGEKTHRLTVAELAAHSHPDGLYAGYPGAVARAGSAPTGESGPAAYGNASAGGDQPHNNLQPYRVANVFIKT